MIPIAHKIRRLRRTLKPQLSSTMSCAKLLRVALLTSCVAIAVTGCANSKLVISPLYNRLDDQMRDEFHKLAKWDDTQIAHFESRVGTFHVWNRQQELPKYANLLETIQQSIAYSGKTSQADVQSWMDEIYLHTRSATSCHPVNYSIDLMKTLSDRQVNYIERRFARERKRNFGEYNERTAEQRRKKRVKDVVKWAGRIGFKFNDKQKSMLDQMFKDQVSLTPKYYALADTWTRDLFAIARKQDAPNYEQKMSAQLNKLWSLVEDAHPKDWQANRDIWRDFTLELIQSLDYDQRLHASKWIKKLSETVSSISDNEPSFKVTQDAKYGCLQ